jgi:isopenicillin N synthase-like dioxygenase
MKFPELEDKEVMSLLVKNMPKRSAGDLKEFWHFGQYVDADSKYASEYPANVTVEELPRFNAVGKEAYQMLEKTGIYVLRALALYLGLDEFYFDNYIKHGNSILRPIHYPQSQMNLQTAPLEPPPMAISISLHF